MTQDLFFKLVSNRVRKVCSNSGCSCTFLPTASYIRVYGRLTIDGSPIIPASLLDSLNSISDIDLVFISVDKDGRLYALYSVKEFTNGNSD